MLMSVNKEKFDRLVITLKYIYGIVAIIIGLDKFFFCIVDWNIYVSPTIMAYLPFFIAAHILPIVGLIEIVAGSIILYDTWTRFGSYLVAAWIGVVIIDLFTIGGLYDIILRDIAIAVGYITLGMLVELKHNYQKMENI
jgi:hypothetical protein